ncbi:unnamed protein product [Phaedon cochleariae]|uniref:Uncharacterized protein n=1 Tax=Phaedon cochleariae TaxID=80249 RepID=A0A9N9SPP5_PHACE|nr:unnamed protein product [Phaedon cochleariae]
MLTYLSILEQGPIRSTHDLKPTEPTTKTPSTTQQEITITFIDDAKLRNTDADSRDLNANKSSPNDAKRTKSLSMEDDLSALLPSPSNYSKSLTTIRRVRQENERLQAEVTRLKRLVVSGATSVLSEKKSVGAIDGEPTEAQALEMELLLAKEALATLKADKRRLKAEKFDLLNQMKQLYLTLEDKEKELRDFIRSYGQRTRDNETSFQQLSTEREERERERWNLLRHARDEAERSLSLAAQLNAKEIQLQQAQEQLQELASSGCLSDQESLASLPRCHAGGALTPSSGGLLGTPSAHALGQLPAGDRGSCSADSGVRVSSDRESGGGTSAAGNLSDSTTEGGGGGREVDAVSMVSSVEQLSSPMEPEPITVNKRSKQSVRSSRGGTWGSISRVFARSRHRNKSNSLQETRITTTMKSMISYGDSNAKFLETVGWGIDSENQPILDKSSHIFSGKLPLKYLMGFAEDYNKGILNVKQELILIIARSFKNCYIGEVDASVEINKIEWKIGHIMPSDKQRLKLLNRLNKSSTAKVKIAYRMWDLYELPSIRETSSDIWAVKTTNSLERPRYIIIGFQNSGNTDNRSKDTTQFIHAGVNNIRLYLNSEVYPYERWNLDFGKKLDAVAYYAYDNFQRSYYGKDMSEPMMSIEEFRKNPLFIIDCSHQPDTLKSSTVDIKLEFETRQSKFPSNTKIGPLHGQVLLELSDLELECGLGLTHPMHRKKIRLAIEEHRNPAMISGVNSFKEMDKEKDNEITADFDEPMTLETEDGLNDEANNVSFEVNETESDGSVELKEFK